MRLLAFSLVLLLSGAAHAAEQNGAKLTYAADRDVQTERRGNEVRTTVIDRFTVAGPESHVPENDALRHVLETFFKTYGIATQMLLANAGTNGSTILARDFCRVTDDHWLHSRPCSWAEREAIDHDRPLPRPDTATLSAKALILERK